MLARFRVLLPYAFSIPCYDKLEPVEFQHGEYRVKLHSLKPGNVEASVAEVTSTGAPIQAMAHLDEATILCPTSAIVVNDQESLQANLIQVDLLAERDFDRRRDAAAGSYDPPLELFFDIANGLIGRLRTVGRLPQATPVTPRSAVGWRIEYLTDDGQLLPRDDSLVRGHHCATTGWSLSVVTAGAWNLANSLPLDYAPSVWDSLLLDAVRQLPDVNPAIVLAHSALESFINAALDVLAEHSRLAPDSWKWLMKRDGFLKEPSVSEKYDQVLFLLTGRSLCRDEPPLWHDFSELKKARNSMVHEGRALVGKKEVTPERAKELVESAGRIISWVEALMPEEKRRVRYTGRAEWRLSRLLVGEDNDADMILVGIGSNVKNMEVELKTDGKK